ncbi:MAG TPA: heme ABC exporter ATP-binding protein CcmA [Terriglobia bacterium]|nr:heme ABC exporter ATP-binding protein CcmA [Terriglobia bacterium]
MPSDESRVELALELQNVSKFFGDLAALKEVHLRFEPGDSVLIYGPNGAGKTTLLRILATLARPSEGRVFFNGKELHGDPAPAKSCIGFVSHATFLYGELSARENLRFAGTLFRLSDIEARIREALELFALIDRADEPVRKLSRGLQQRASLARAFLHDPDFLLLDEPFTGLDAASAENLRAILRGLPERGKTVVFSTHDFEQGASIARRLVALDSGRVKYDGPLQLAPLSALGIANEKAESSRR